MGVVIWLLPYILFEDIEQASLKKEEMILLLFFCNTGENSHIQAINVKGSEGDVYVIGAWMDSTSVSGRVKVRKI